MKYGILAVFLFLSLNLYAEVKVLAFSGSLREGSINKKLVLEAGIIASQMGAQVTIIDLKDYPMPFYDGDLEKNGKPEMANRFFRLMTENKVILIASPEYNGSISAVLKNAIDWASRTEKAEPTREAFKEKKFVIMSASPGSGGGARGLVHLKSILEGMGGTVLSPEVMVPMSYDAFDEQGHLKDPKIKRQLQEVIKHAMAA